MNESIEKAMRLCRILIGDKRAVSEKEIEDAIEKVTRLDDDLAGIDRDGLKKELLAMYNVRIEPWQELLGREARIPWLNGAKAGIKWNFWSRYKRYLSEEKNFSTSAIDQIDQITDNVLDKLFDPRRNDIKIRKKGLVVGQVQSGKTANYTGLICKAADAGFNVIVVLAGLHNSLRSQTQTRLDEGFLGFDTQYGRANSRKEQNVIGVGRLGDKHPIAHSITTSLDKGDFRKPASSLGFNFSAEEPILMVVKKNKTILEGLNMWMASQPEEVIANKSLLIIDDEADNASINTAREDEGPTAINKQIREIISRYLRSAYVGYTATPFANIFIPLEKNDDLFPRDFIIKIPAPSNYIGPEKVFGVSSDMDKDESTLLPIVTTIRDYESFVSDRHKKDDELPTTLPESLKEAIKVFILVCAIRIKRGQENQHNSMLIHVSRFQRWQNSIKQLVEDQFRFYKQEIDANDSSTIEEFRSVFEEDKPGYKSMKTVSEEIMNSALRELDDSIQLHSWAEIQPLLYRAVQKIEVKAINGTSGDTLSYYDNKKTGISIIAIGGDKLSRGLTLEGLSVSYFLRASKMYDTLMQMGRWFGYRRGYMDLCRLYTSAELNEWYRHITMASMELMEEFDYLASSGGTPDSYALKVRSHPGCLQITSVAKMRYTYAINVSWAGRLVETYQLKIDKGVIQRNFASTESLLKALGDPQVRDTSYYLWKGANPQHVCDYLLSLEMPESLRKVNFELIVDYIRQLVKAGELTSWSVALFNQTGKGQRYKIDKYNVGGFMRRTDEKINKMNDDIHTYYIIKNHIISKQNEFVDLDDSLLRKAVKEHTTKNKEGDANLSIIDVPATIVRQQYRPKEQPLLMIFLLDPTGANMEIKDALKFEHTDTPFIGLAISFPHTDTDCAVEYRTNQVPDIAASEQIFDETNDNKYARD